MGAYRKVEMALDIYIYALLTAPSLVFAPVFFAIFGLSQVTILAVIVMYSRLHHHRQHRLPRSGTCRRRSSRWAAPSAPRSASSSAKVILPAALPLIMAGLRLGMGRAVKGMINGEMFIAIVGLGAVVMSAGRRFDAAGVLAVLLVIIVVAIVAVKLVQIVDRRLTSWLPDTARQGRTGRATNAG